jgi:hypothetical protein
MENAWVIVLVALVLIGVWLGSRRRIRRPKWDESVSASAGGQWATDDGWGGNVGGADGGGGGGD